MYQQLFIILLQEFLFSLFFFFLRSIDVAVSSKADCYVVTSLLRDNRIELVHMKPKIKEFITKSQTISSGHRSESKSACFTSNNQQFVTTASQSAKLWNR